MGLCMPGLIWFPGVLILILFFFCLDIEMKIEWPKSKSTEIFRMITVQASMGFRYSNIIFPM